MNDDRFCLKQIRKIINVENLMMTFNVDNLISFDDILTDHQMIQLEELKIVQN